MQAEAGFFYTVLGWPRYKMGAALSAINTKHYAPAYCLMFDV